jgi:hypothetical protein
MGYQPTVIDKEEEKAEGRGGGGEEDADRCSVHQ